MTTIIPQHRINEQWKLYLFQTLKNLQVLKVFVLDEERFVYRVFEDRKEYWYILDGDILLKTDIIHKSKNKDYYTYTLHADNHSFKMLYDGKHIFLDNERYGYVNDIYAIRLFYDIHRMNSS